ncbi:MAG TPA: glycosyltransferase family 4 protein [Anaerohalosphaeraceae bacterium]|nr:glycosyltransferase family 4 protein [Anaerohalosphaeraceae bacterium]HOL88438.1 glycosyltransferase family 4 protein [Anaerohalosphaeraceae bacterium]HPP56985.1 glycosyltransferase family 4 protein [Anaerohalosphaeraceae bacterium]
MPPDENNTGGLCRKVCRPLLFVRPEVLRLYPGLFRSMLVGLVGSSYRPALAGPQGSDFYKVLCPSVEVFEYPQNWQFRRRSRAMQEFIECLRYYRPTVLHGVWPAHARLLHFLSESFEVPYILSFFDFPKKLFCRLFPFEQADALTAASEPILQVLQQSGRGQLPPIHLIRPGCYTEDACVCFSDSSRLPSLILVHPLDRADALEPFLQALRHLRLDGFDFFAAILGSGRAEHAVRRRVRTLGLRSNLSVVPMEESIRDVLSGADIFVYLNPVRRFEPLLLEVMGTGLAIAGAPDPAGGLLQDGVTALWLEPNNELSIYTALKKLLSRPELARQLASAAQDYVRRHHPVSGMIEQLVEVYKTVQKP